MKRVLSPSQSMNQIFTLNPFTNRPLKWTEACFSGSDAQMGASQYTSSAVQISSWSRALVQGHLIDLDKVHPWYLPHVQKHVSSGSLCFWGFFFTNFCFRGSKRRNLSNWMKSHHVKMRRDLFFVCQSSIYSKAPALFWLISGSWSCI